MLEHARVVDLTKIVDRDLDIYSEGAYRDPDFQADTWSTHGKQGYWVSKLSLGTQTGTHIDTPAHFKPNGDTLETLPVENLLGRYFWVDLDHLSSTNPDAVGFSNYLGERILFLSSASGQAEIEIQQLEQLCSLPAKVWAVVGTVAIRGQDALYFHRHLAEQGIFLIEDLDQEACKSVKPGGELIALPLRLRGLSGSPCRVLVLQW